MTITYVGEGRFILQNFDKSREATKAQLIALGKDVAGLVEVAQRTPSVPVQVRETRNPQPRHKRIFSNIIQ